MTEILSHQEPAPVGQGERRRKMRSEASIVIQRRLIEHYLDQHLAGATTSEDERNAFVLTWVNRYAKDFRERVMEDPELLRAIDENRLDDAVMRSAQLLYKAEISAQQAA